MRILLTGAGGQLGQALQETFGAHEVTALTHARLDIADAGRVREAIENARPDVVVNAAAYNDVDGAESNPDAAYRGNAVGPGNLARASADAGIALLHVSTDYVFDGRSGRPYHELDRAHPLSIYGASKLAGEEAVREHNARSYIVRTAWLYHTVGRNFARTMCALAGRPEVRVVDDQHGSPTYVPHLAAALATLIETKAYGIYHLAGRGGTSWFDLTRRLYRALGIATPVHPIKSEDLGRPAARPAFSVLTTIQEPTILLPAWEEGVEAFARALR